jgi:hypothetical protein
MTWARIRDIVAGIALAALLVAACSRPGPAAPSATIAGANASSATPSSPTASPAPLPSDIAYAVAQRQRFGLRSDVAWVEQVASDPAARVGMLDIPLTPAEEQWFGARQATFDQVVAAVQAEAAAAQDQFGGVYIDQPGGRVMALFTANLDLHRQAILDRLGPAAPLAVQQVVYPEATLRALQDRISSDIDWLKGIDAAALAIGVDVIRNRTTLELSSANPDAPGLALAHYGVPADELAVTEDGTGAALLPRGTIDITVTAPTGVPVPASGWELEFAGDGPGECGGEVGYGVVPGRVTEVPCQIGGWTVRLLDESRAVVASGHVTVVAGSHVGLAIAVP